MPYASYIDHTHEAFFETLPQAQPAAQHYCSLYLRVPYYGGPEEGGWWGHDDKLVAYEPFPTRELAEDARERAQARCKELNRLAEEDFGNTCLQQMEWLEARGLDSDFLPEPGGPVSYWIGVEDELGSCNSYGPRHYE